MSDPDAAEPEIPVDAKESETEPTIAKTSPEKTPIKKNIDDKKLAQLAKARLRAAEVNRQKKEQRLRDKVAAMDQETIAQPRASASHEQPIVVVEQSESDEDHFEAPGVVFVRRRRPKPAVPQKTAEELEMDRLYIRMFG